MELTSDQEDFVEEGTRVRFRCEAHANPTQLTYAWYVGGRKALETSTELVLDHVDRRLHNHVVKCEVTNPIGKTEESAIINVACKCSSTMTWDSSLTQLCFRSTHVHQTAR